jgi:hypothetical protein
MTVTTTERKRVEEAVETLARYNKSPYITDFIKQQPKPRIVPHKYDKAELCALIKQVLLGEYQGRKKYVLKLEELIAHLDRLQETGRQHLYSFRLPEEGRDKLLARLRNFEEVKDLLGGEDELYKGGCLVWDAKDRPKLAVVRHDRPTGDSEPRRLLLKWVETRSFWVPQQATGTSEFEDAGEEEGAEKEAEELEESTETQEERQNQRVQIRVLREERAITFFVVDLESGDCEFRIRHYAVERELPGKSNWPLTGLSWRISLDSSLLGRPSWRPPFVELWSRGRSILQAVGLSCLMVVSLSEVRGNSRPLTFANCRRV